MENKVIITAFTDPMMGLSWEMEPVMRKLETHYAGNIEFRNVMGLLVRNVYELTAPGELKKGRQYALDRCLERLAAIYRDEEGIHQMPIPMEKCVLFSREQTSTMPLDLAYYAAREAGPEKAEQFLYRLRYATVVECRQTTREDEILRVAVKSGIRPDEFLKHFHGDEVKESFNRGLAIMRQVGIRSLPAYMIQYMDRALLVQTFSYDDFTEAIRRVSGGRITGKKPERDLAAAEQLLQLHPLISVNEVREALDFESDSDVSDFLKPLEEQEKIVVYDVPHGRFIRSGMAG